MKIAASVVSSMSGHEVVVCTGESSQSLAVPPLRSGVPVRLLASH